jgi:hypothetical protein
METIREKFLTTCTGCDGSGEYEEPIGGFENEVTYKTTQCDCENGKELNLDLIYKEIEKTKDAIKHYNESTNIVLQLAREYHDKQDLSLIFDAIGKMKYYETKVSELEEYLAQLEEI